MWQREIEHQYSALKPATDLTLIQRVNNVTTVLEYRFN